MTLDPVRLAAFATDVAWAFGLKDGAARPLVFDAPRSDKEAHAIVRRLEDALANVRPVSRAPSVGETLAALAATPTPKAKRRALAELVELVAQGTHHRAKRQERARLLGELVLLFELDASLDVTVPPDAAPDAVAVARAIDAVLASRARGRSKG